MENYTIEQLEDEIIRRRTEAEHRFLPATTTMATTNLRKVLENIESIRATSRAINLDTQTTEDVRELLGTINRAAYTAMCKIDQDQKGNIDFQALRDECAIIDDVESLKELYERVKKDGISPAQEKYVNEIINKRKKELEQ